MFKSLWISVVLNLAMLGQGWAQSSAQPTLSTASHHSPSQDKLSWQRLNLMLSATYYRVVKEGVLDFDSCLLYVSRSLGLSRVSVLAEGFDDPQLIAHSQWIDQRNPAAGLRQLEQAKGKRHLEVLLLLSAYYAFQPQSYYNRDSVTYFLSKAIQESKALEELRLGRQALCLLGKMYFELNDVKKGDSVFSQLIQDCKIAGDRETEARALVFWGSYPPYSPSTTPNRIAYFQKAADIYRELKNIEGEIIALTDAGYLLVTTFQLRMAYDAFLKSLQLAEAINYPYTHYNTEALAMVTEFEGKFGEPLKYTLQTIKAAETTKDSIGWSYFYYRLGNLYLTEGGREEESLKWFLEALDRFVKADDASLYQNLFSVAGMMSRLGQSNEALDVVTSVSKQVPPKHPQDQVFYNLSFAKCYKNLKQFKLAEQYAREADRIQQRSVTLRSAYQKAMINMEFGFIYFDDRQFDRSKRYLELCLSEPSFPIVLANKIDVYARLIAIDSVFGDAPAAVKHYKQYVQLLDSNFRVSKIRQAEELQVMYETEEKENQIALLNERANLEQAKLKQATLVKNVTIAGIVAVLIIAGLLYRQNRVKQKNNMVITNKNDQLQHLLAEKEWLLKEIHHRVKNNLQVVMSLLNSQTAYIDNEPALTAIHDSQHRVHAMSLIHQKLYSTDNVSSIDMSVYIREMVSYLRDSFDTGQRIQFDFSIEPIEMDVSQAVPIGLILNEAITNSLKYAFPKNRPGVISISFTQADAKQCILMVSDNGIGLPSSFNNKGGSLGMSLMNGLSQDLDGNFSIESNNGTTIKISFAHDLGVNRSNTNTTTLLSDN